MVPARAFGNDEPELVLLDAAYGRNAAVVWLMPQLLSVGEFAGVREKMDDMQTLELARVIRAKYGFLTVAEVMYFFFNLKAGKYGKFYGAVDPMVITEALGKFLDERDRHLTKQANEAARAERESWHNRPGILNPKQVQELRERMERQWEEEQAAAEQRHGKP